MRVLLTADTVGGVWDYATNLVRYLDAAGHDVLVAIFGEPGDRQRQLPPAVEVVARPYRLEWMPDSRDDVDAANGWLERLADRWEADVIHLNQFCGALASFEAPTIVVAHSDVLSWFSETLGASPPEGWDLYAHRVRSAVWRATVLVAPSHYQSTLLKRHYGRAADRIIHNGVVPPSTLSSQTESLVVCAARAWDAAKGIRTLDAAASRLDRAAVPVQLFGATESPQGERLLPLHLVQHGQKGRDEVDGWLQRASVYVAPSLYEPFGLAPLEAALHGCALVLSDIGSFRELWDGCAEFFPAGDSERLAEILSGLPTDRKRLAHLSGAARRRALRRYTAERMADAYLRLYAELHAERQGARSHPALRQPA